MQTKQYIERNLKGFEGDELIYKEIKKIAKEHHIKVAVESGTYLGGTTKRLAELFTHVHSLEIDGTNAIQAIKHTEDCPNVNIYQGNSSTDLLPLLKDIKQQKVFFFLDAHWLNHCPLLDELAQIAESKKIPFLAVHDFFNPNHTDFGFDTYNGQRLDFDYIKEALDKIYPLGYQYYYNESAQGAKRGIIYILPK